MKKVFFTLILILIMLVIIEGSLWLADFVRGGSKDSRELFSSYKGKDWAPELIKDYRIMTDTHKTGFAPYILFKEEEFHTKYVNIDKSGIRLTWNPEFPAGSNPKLIYMFGGSTMFGSGARDEGTIPSFVSKMLNANTSQHKVINEGQGAFTFTQEVIKLVTLLRNGERPDYVIFYDGYNDVTAAYEAGHPGALLFEQETKQALTSKYLGRAVLGIKETIRDYCKTCKAAADLIHMFNISGFHGHDVIGEQYDDGQIKNLSEGISDEYKKSLELVDGLSKTYNFKYLAFWQPQLYLDNAMIGDESKITVIDWKSKDKNLASLAELTAKNLANYKLPHFYDISDALRSRTTQIYLDSVHISEDGNQMIALRMVDVFKKEFVINGR